MRSVLPSGSKSVANSNLSVDFMCTGVKAVLPSESTSVVNRDFSDESMCTDTRAALPSETTSIAKRHLSSLEKRNGEKEAKQGITELSSKQRFCLQKTTSAWKSS